MINRQEKPEDKDFINKFPAVIGLSIIVILLSAFFAISTGNTLVSPGHAVSASYSTYEALTSLRNFHDYKDQSLSAGKFLVASEKIRDPRFANTVILLVQYDFRGTIGLIINRPTETKLSQVLPNVKGIEKAPDNLYFGGPVAFNRITLLIQSPGKPENSKNVFDDIYISNSLTLLEQIIENQKPDQRFRLYSGYAGWSPGQLETEIARNDWIILKGDPAILFDKSPDKIWQKFVPRNISI
jgi:putative transcriptional regulator